MHWVYIEQCATSKKNKKKVLSSIRAHLFCAATKSVNRAQRVGMSERKKRNEQKPKHIFSWKNSKKGEQNRMKM